MKITRRNILLSSAKGLGLILAYNFTPIPPLIKQGQTANNDWNHQLFLTMNKKGIATIHINKCELGQHVGTAIAQMVAEELEIDWEKIRLNYPTAEQKWGIFITGGSWSVHRSFEKFSKIGASARISLINGAAEILGINSNDCYAEKGYVKSKKNNLTISYADILKKKNISKNFSQKELDAIKLKKFNDYKVIGKSFPSLDVPSKVTGKAKYGIDVFVPNMVYGFVFENPTRTGSFPLKINDNLAKAVDGYVGTFMEKNGNKKINSGYVVVFGETYWAAEKASKLVKVDWQTDENKKINSSDLRNEAIKLIEENKKGLLFVNEGNAKASISNNKNYHKAVYETSLAYHGCMEPMNCTAFEKDGKWHIHSSSQFYTYVIQNIASALNIDKKNIICNQYYAGTGFGRRIEADYCLLAVFASNYIKRPVKLIYSREYDMRFDFHRSLTYQTIEAGFSEKKIGTMIHNVVAGWSTKRVVPGWMKNSLDRKGKLDKSSTKGSDHWYNIPNQLVKTFNNELSDRVAPSGFLRAVSPGWTFWAVESFIDELAIKTSQDPLEFRLNHLISTGKNKGKFPHSVGGADRLKNVLIIAAGHAGYGVKKLEKNVGMGIAVISAQERKAPIWTACVAEVHVNQQSAEITPKKLTIAMDVGTAINIDAVKKQIEGSALHGLSLAIHENITLKEGRIEQGNFDNWTPLRLDQTPKISVIVVQNGHFPVGAGEPATTVVAPAIGNAIANAVGVRIRSLPITREKIKLALKRS